MKRVLILCAAAAAFASAAHAGERCVEPYAPTVKLPANATRQDVAALREDAQAFLTASDVYQKCLTTRGGSEVLIHANQAAKQKVGREFNALLHEFQAARASGVAEIADRS